MKPLDLQVGIQNSYEAARSEGVRLEKPHVLNQLANEDARREQVHRDESVMAPESGNLQEDLFQEQEYESPDYANADGSSGKRRQKKNKPAVPVENKEEVKPEEEKPHPGFSTYA